ncbi:MAG: RIP metalloprotease RseP [bacterium]
MNQIVSGFADVVVLVALFGLAIFVHELGHFLAARLCGMVVEVFSIGFGPAIWSKKIKGVLYKISWFPIGGYVALPQLDPAGMEAVQGKEAGDKQTAEPGQTSGETTAYPPVALWKKIVVSIAGPLGNVILAVILAWVIYFASTGDEIEKGSTVVGYVATNSAAYELGMRPGDTITAVNGRPVSSWIEYRTECHLTAKSTSITLTVASPAAGTQTMVLATQKDAESGISLVEGVDRTSLCVIAAVLPGAPADRAGFKPKDVVISCNGNQVASRDHFIALVADGVGKEISISVDRQGKSIDLSVTPQFNKERNRAVIGVEVSDRLKTQGAQWMEYKDPWDQLKGDARAIGRILKALTSRTEASQAAGALGGPVMIMMTLWISIQTSLLNALGFIRFLCVNLAILNLLPLPVLDGGHVVFALWEMITRRKPHPKFVNILVYTFACLLLTAVILLTFRDFKLVTRFFKHRAAQVEQTNAAAALTPTNGVGTLETNTPAAGPEQQETK